MEFAQDTARPADGTNVGKREFDKVLSLSGLAAISVCARLRGWSQCRPTMAGGTPMGVRTRGQLGLYKPHQWRQRSSRRDAHGLRLCSSAVESGDSATNNALVVLH